VILAAGIFCAIAVAGSAAWTGLRGLRLWRASRSLSRRAAEAVAVVTGSAARAEERARGLKAEQLTAAVARLQESLAELAAIRRAAAEPQALLRSLRGAVPRK
jgi:hypothetical protein